MNFFKPKFWDKNQISFFSILFFPISIMVIFLGYIKRSITKTEKFPIPIICVGNIYLGGTGKTPICIETFSILKNLNMNPVFIRKKYTSFQDEVSLQKKVGSVYQSTKRKEALNEAIKNGANVAVLDDGFQDFSINKNLTIVCFHEKQLLGNGLVIPSGPLRETLSSLKRANCVIINGKKNDDFEKKILDKNKKIKIFYSKYKFQNVEKFKNKDVIAFAGIGNPENFFSLLKENNINVIEKFKFPDHYNYNEKEIKNLINKSKEKNVILITTEKDYLRINENNKKDVNYLKVLIEIENRNQLIEEIKKII